MYLYLTAKILIFLLFELKEVFQARAIILENEITKPLNKWFASIFKLAANETYDFDASDEKALEYLETEKRFFDQLYFTDLSGAGELDFKFATKNLRLFHRQLTINIYGKFRKQRDTPFMSFDINLTFENSTITVVASPGPLTEVVTSTSFSYDRFRADFQKSDWVSDSRELGLHEKYELQRDLPTIFVEHQLNGSLDSIFHKLVQPRNEFMSEFPRLLDNPEQFYYLISRAPFFCFLLKRIVIINLWNLDSFKMPQEPDLFTHTLLVKDIKGSMILDYKSEKEAPLKLKFKIGNLYVMTKQETNCVSVLAEYWKIYRANSSLSLSTRQSQVLIHGLESAIASSISSSMKVVKVCNIEAPVEAIKITNISDWDMVKKSYKGWIPFNDDV